MYAVIFKAKIKQLDDEYFETAQRMRELAMSQYGCLDFTSLSEGDEEQIKNWQQDAEHLLAQALGRNRWYESYQVEVVTVIRQYSQKSGPAYSSSNTVK